LKEKHEKYVGLLLENIDFCKELEEFYEEERDFRISGLSESQID
jgi:hypothetical protein